MPKKEIKLYAQGELAPRQDKAVAKKAKKIYDAARLAVFEVEATEGLADHIIGKAVHLHEKARAAAKGDAAVEMLVAEYTANAYRKMAKIQSKFNDGDWLS